MKRKNIYSMVSVQCYCPKCFEYFDDNHLKMLCSITGRPKHMQLKKAFIELKVPDKCPCCGCKHVERAYAFTPTELKKGFDDLPF